MDSDVTSAVLDLDKPPSASRSGKISSSALKKRAGGSGTFRVTLAQKDACGEN